MAQILKLPPEPWQLDAANVMVAVKDARGQVVCWINKSHPCAEGIAQLFSGAAPLAGAVFSHLARPTEENKKQLGDLWKKLRTKKDAD